MSTETAPTSTQSTTAVQVIAFAGERLIAVGDPIDVALAVKETVERDDPARVLVFDRTTSRPVEFDLRGSEEEVAARLRGASAQAERAPAQDETPPTTRRGPGRPKLGVVGREVTLLPRHWQWLSSQPGGASVTLRKLVDRARKESARGEDARRAQESAYRFVSAVAGNLSGFEEATRALFAGDRARFESETETWPTDVRDHARALAATSFQTT